MLIRLAALAALERRRREGRRQGRLDSIFYAGGIKEKRMHIHPEIRQQAIMLRAMLAASF